MSFRVRLTLFFVLIVVVPMIALGVVVARLLSAGEHANVVAQSRASAAAALADYRRLTAAGARDARALARDRGLAAALRTPTPQDDRMRAISLAARLGLARVRLMTATGAVLADVGSQTAIARGVVRLRPADGPVSGAPGLTIEAASPDATAARLVRTVSFVH